MVYLNKLKIDLSHIEFFKGVEICESLYIFGSRMIKLILSYESKNWFFE